MGILQTNALVLVSDEAQSLMISQADTTHVLDIK
jgi:hypothetical protein